MTVTPSDGLRQGWGAQKSRVITWHDPLPTAALRAPMAGLDLVRAVMDQQLPPPPMHKLMQFGIVSVESGRVIFTCAPDESAYNSIGIVHGGLVCALLDTVMGCATHTTLPEGKGFTSIEIKVNYLKAVQLSSGLLTATGTVVKSGARVAFAEGTVTDASGALVATASSTLLVVDLANQART